MTKAIKKAEEAEKFQVDQFNVRILTWPTEEDKWYAYANVTGPKRGRWDDGKRDIFPQRETYSYKQEAVRAAKERALEYIRHVKGELEKVS